MKNLTIELTTKDIKELNNGSFFSFVKTSVDIKKNEEFMITITKKLSTRKKHSNKQ